MIILASQMSTAEWHKKLGSGAIADAILDRAINNSYHIFISGDSMRRENSKDQTDLAGKINRDSAGKQNRDFVFFLTDVCKYKFDYAILDLPGEVKIYIGG